VTPPHAHGGQEGAPHAHGGQGAPDAHGGQDAPDAGAGQDAPVAGAGPGGSDASSRRLAGRTVVVTRPRGQAGGLAALLELDGARVLPCPVIEIVPLGLTAELQGAIERLDSYETVIFTSANGVAVFCARLRDCGREPAALSASELVAIGPATAAALEERGLAASVVPEQYLAEGVIAELDERARRLAGRRVLLARAREARPVLPDELRRRGALVDVVALYDTVPAAALPCPAADIAAADYITFTSSSTVRCFVVLMGAGDLAARLRGVRLASLGPVTSATLRELGLPVALEAAVFTAAGLAEAIAADAGGAPPA
jgi:uroporphyrinogen III methyltransferase / synthase